MAGLPLKVSGVTFDTLRAALTDLYFRYTGMGQEEFDEAQKYVVPMKHNFLSPITPGSQDTWIQYWIDDDDRLTHDRNEGNFNTVQKVARCTVRFLGNRAEVWAKAFHHLTKRKHCAKVLIAYCNAMLLPYVGPIVPRNVDYFGAGNTTVAFTINFKLQYDEVIDFTEGSGGDRLEYLSFAAGQVVDGNVEGGLDG